MTVEKLKTIKLLILDVDGVLTDGGIIYHDSGAESKIFDVKDGLGIRLLMYAGIKICIVTGRKSKALNNRCKDLGIHHIYDGVRDKTSVLNQILRSTGVSAGETAFMGDDLIDIPLMKQVGFSIAVCDAHEIVREYADMTTLAKGGSGAVREVCESILKAKDLWENILKRFV